MVEVLSAALQQGNFLKALSGIGSKGEKVPYHLGHFFMAIDTEAFMGLEEFKKTAGDIMRELRASEKAPVKKEYIRREKKSGLYGRKEKIKSSINEGVQKELIDCRNEYGLGQYRFPFE